ncbi:SCO family protein [Rubrivirga sp.]|uniref:SCO family protein n=1 Tax=Rubrivirga sp. TaxID=1885344 RepID=UPI003B52AD87
MTRLIPLLALTLTACGGRPDHLAPEDDLTDLDVALVNQDSTAFAFPAALDGRVAYVTAVYTNCPDVCPMTMAQTQKVRQALGPDADRVQFVALTFDPARDTPAALRRYAETWEIGPGWRLATGDSATVGRLMDRLGIRVEESRRDTFADGRVYYALSHTDKALLIDQDGRVVETYGGSAAPPEMVAEDVRALL